MKKAINFMKYRYIGYIIPLIIILIGAVFAIKNGFTFDIDFKGGTTIQASLNEEYNNNDISIIVKEITGKAPLIQKITGGNNSVTITTEVIPNEVSEQIVSKLQEKYVNISEPSTRNVQPAYGKELINSALLAVGVSVILLLLYIGIRFRKLGFIPAVTAILGLVHDVLIIASIYAIFGLPINSTFVAVILTIIGYSINDTIIVYDRIRENKKKVNLSKDMKETINISLNQTLKRTIYTSLTTIVAIAVVYTFAAIYNQQVLKEFSLPLMIGIIAGTYSSMFISSALWYTLNNLKNKFSKSKKIKN